MPSSPQKQYQSLCVLVPSWAATALEAVSSGRVGLGLAPRGSPASPSTGCGPPHTLPYLHSHQGTDGRGHWPPQTQQLHGLSWVALREDGWCSQSASYRPACRACLAALWT